MSSSPPWHCTVCQRTREAIRLKDATECGDYSESLMALTYHLPHVPGRKVIVCRRCVQGLNATYAAAAAWLRQQQKPPTPPVPPPKPRLA